MPESKKMPNDQSEQAKEQEQQRQELQRLFRSPVIHSDPYTPEAQQAMRDHYETHHFVKVNREAKK